MTLKTKESLQRMFEESRERQKKKATRLERKQQSLQRLKEIYYHQDQILKKSLQEEKKKVMDNLQALLKKRSQNVRKLAPIEYEEYQEKYQLWETNESDLYNTIEELQEAEKRGEGKINWDVWQKLVNNRPWESRK